MKSLSILHFCNLGHIKHRGYTCDVSGRILPLWVNPLDQFSIDPLSLEYRPIYPEYPDLPPRPEREKSPAAPPVWESQADLDALIKMLKEVGFRLGVKDIISDKVGNANAAKKQGERTKHFMQVATKVKDL